MLQELSFGELLLKIGLIVLILALAFGIIMVIVFAISGRRLKQKLCKEYGEKLR